MSVISVAGHHVVKNLSEPCEITLVHLDIYTEYIRGTQRRIGLNAVLEKDAVHIGCKGQAIFRKRTA